MKLRKVLFVLVCLLTFSLKAEDGYRLWLRHDLIQNKTIRNGYALAISKVNCQVKDTITATAVKELTGGLSKMLGKTIGLGKVNNMAGNINLYLTNETVANLLTKKGYKTIQNEGYVIFSDKNQIHIVAKDSKGLLYGAYNFLSIIQQEKDIKKLNIQENPHLQLRMLNHWDNLDRTVERGYAGFSIWNWHELPDFLDPRYIEYARANASVGINATALTNVNANQLIFRQDYIEKAAALANILRPYGIKVYLTARFSSPKELGGLPTADPNDPAVKKWWEEKVKEIYQAIPDFGGFLVKANSEGQPGPQEYGRTHADGANVLADALAPFGGNVIWRAFVYSNEEPVDRAKQAYNEFVPLDGQFRKNVMVQVKNGPVDFQPREPIHPLFGALPKTPIMMEFQITKEYLGQGTHTVGLSNLFEEVLKTDTYAKGKGSLVAKVIDGTLDGHQLTGMAGVSNIGTARNWTGNLFGQADWYAYGKLAWNPYANSDDIFEEWSNLTFGTSKKVQSVVTNILDKSHEYCVQYMTPLGLHHIMAANHHYGPGPWVSNMSRADWTSVYYHKADEKGVGFDRTESGTNALEQYYPGLANQYRNKDSIDLKFLLWFHHVAWDHKLSTGKTLWDELCYQYQQGVDGINELANQWQSLKGQIDEERFNQVTMHFNIQKKEAKWWRDSGLAYFQTFSKMEIPSDLPKLDHDLNYYKNINHPMSPGIRPRW